MTWCCYDCHDEKREGEREIHKLEYVRVEYTREFEGEKEEIAFCAPGQNKMLLNKEEMVEVINGLQQGEELTTSTELVTSFQVKIGPWRCGHQQILCGYKKTRNFY